MTTTTTAQVQTLHPRPARKPAAAQSPRKRKAKATIEPLHGWQNLDMIVRRGLADTRAVLGLASGLHELFALRLANSEEELARLGKAPNDDAGAARYIWRRHETDDLRIWVGVLDAIKDRATRAESDAHSAAERVGYAVRKGGAA